MANMDEIYDALRKADAAGDTESVQKLSAYIKSAPKQEPKERTWRNVVAEYARPTLEFGGMLAGGVIGGAGGLATGPAAPVAAPAATAAGGALGYAGGAQAADIVDESLGVRSRPAAKQVTGNVVADELIQGGRDVVEGAKMEAMGQSAGVAIPAIAKQAGKVVKPVLGRLNATGTATVDQALKAGKKEGLLGGYKFPSEFTKAEKGRITGEEIVGNAKTALQGLKQARSEAYKKQLAQISDEGHFINLNPVKDKAQKIFKKFVSFDKAGNPVWERTKISRTNIGPIRDLYDDVMSWGSKQGDNTPAGLDMLKSNIDDLYSESNSGRALITQLRNAVKDELVETVPKYAKMTKGYEEATKLIKDVEAGLMMRKQGMSGRIVADQTLRRLLSSMKDNFELRGELVRALAREGGADLQGQIAGHLSKDIIPSGMSGTGTALAMQGVAVYLKPELWPMLAAASPKVSNNFLRYYGQALKEVGGTAPTVGRAIAYETKKEEKPNNDPLGIR